jgi:hypothetical protein
MSDYAGALLIARLIGLCFGLSGVGFGLWLRYWTGKNVRPAIEWAYLLGGTSFILIFNNFIFPATVASVALIAIGVCVALVVGSVLAAVAYYEAEQAEVADTDTDTGADTTPDAVAVAEAEASAHDE